MTTSADVGSDSRCRLCAARAACDIITAAEFELRGFDQFSIDPDICDACVRMNYRWHWVWGTLSQWLALTMGGFLAVIVSVVMALGVFPWKVLPHGLFIARVWALYVPCVVCVWFVVKGLDWLRSYRARGELRKKLAENPVLEAEEFYWLAVWGKVTGRARYSRRMLRRAVRLGAKDVRHLSTGT